MGHIHRWFVIFTFVFRYILKTNKREITRVCIVSILLVDQICLYRCFELKTDIAYIRMYMYILYKWKSLNEQIVSSSLSLMNCCGISESVAYCILYKRTSLVNVNVDFVCIKISIRIFVKSSWPFCVFYFH